MSETCKALEPTRPILGACCPEPLPPNMEAVFHTGYHRVYGLRMLGLGPNCADVVDMTSEPPFDPTPTMFSTITTRFWSDAGFTNTGPWDITVVNETRMLGYHARMAYVSHSGTVLPLPYGPFPAGSVERRIISRSQTEFLMEDWRVATNERICSGHAILSNPIQQADFDQQLRSLIEALDITEMPLGLYVHPRPNNLPPDYRAYFHHTSHYEQGRIMTAINVRGDLVGANITFPYHSTLSASAGSYFGVSNAGERGLLFDVAPANFPPVSTFWPFTHASMSWVGWASKARWARGGPVCRLHYSGQVRLPPACNVSNLPAFTEILPAGTYSGEPDFPFDYGQFDIYRHSEFCANPAP